MGKKSITKRWLLNNMGIILMIMMVLEMILIYVVQNYYYNSAKQYLTSKLNAVTSVLSLYADDGTVNFSSEVRNMVENFSEKDRMELMAINSKGKISMTSSGFSPDAAVYMSDYEEAMKAENKYGYYVGKQDSGERITPKAWQREIDQLAAGKQTDTLAMKSMREDLKAVERLRKTAEQLSRQERDKSHDREPER